MTTLIPVQHYPHRMMRRGDEVRFRKKCLVSRHLLVYLAAIVGAASSLARRSMR